MVDIPNEKFVYLRSASAVFQYDQSGSAYAPLDPAAKNVLDLTKFRKISIFISGTKAKKANLYIGQVTGQTALALYNVPIDANIHTFEVVGPEMQIQLTGAPSNAKETISDPVQIWVYLKS